MAVPCHVICVSRKPKYLNIWCSTARQGRRRRRRLCGKLSVLLGNGRKAGDEGARQDYYNQHVDGLEVAKNQPWCVTHDAGTS